MIDNFFQQITTLISKDSSLDLQSFIINSSLFCKASVATERAQAIIVLLSSRHQDGEDCESQARDFDA